MLIPGTLFAIIWIGCLHLFGEKWKSTQLMHHAIIETGHGSLTGTVNPSGNSST